jgi:predicted nucleotide-binding protein
MRKMEKAGGARKADRPAVKRPYVKQSDVPSASLDEALRIPQAILDHYAGKPAAPIHIAKALNMAPNGSQIQVLSGASIAFGLIEGGAQAASVSVTELAKQILRPKQEGEDLIAKRAAMLRPRVYSEFLLRYDGSPLPRQDIGQNVLEELGVPRDKTAEILERIIMSAQSVGFVEEIKGKQYISLQGSVGHTEPTEAETGQTDALEDRTDQNVGKLVAVASAKQSSAIAVAIIDDERRKRVFITHGKNRALVEPVKRLLEYGELEPVISVERQSVSKPVPEKVMDDMRSCGAAIIHVDVEQAITDKDGNEHVFLNPNVLIEIGAAMAFFYGRRFILLVREGVKLPSNLQGLYEVRYTGDAVDANATIRLLEAIKDIKNHALPKNNLSAAA